MAPNPILTRSNFWTIALNSTSAYIVASMLVFYINHVFTILGSALFGYDLSFDYNNIFYHIESYEWTHDAVKVIFSAGPFMLLITGIVAIILFNKLSEETTRIKILFLWIALISFNFFFSGLLIGNLFRNGIGHVFSWMYLKDTEKLIVALLGLFGLVAVALLLARPTAMSTNVYVNQLNEDNFPFMITAQIIVPFILGTIISIAYHIPRILFQERYSWITLALMLVIITVRSNSFNTIFFDEEERKIRLAWIPIVLTVVFVIALRWGLNSPFLFVW